MTTETPENPMQITDCIKTTLCLENYKKNYPQWEGEIFDVLHGHGLLDFLYGTNLPSTPADGTTSVEFERWQTKDKVIRNWLFSTLPPDTQSNLGQLAPETTHQLWKSLYSMYSTDPLPSEFNLEDPPFITKTSTRSSRTPENPIIPHTSSTSENPIQINHQISIPLNEENYQPSNRVLGDLGLQDSLDGTAQYAPPAQLVTSTYAGPSQPSAPSPPTQFLAINYRTFPPLTDGQSQCEICFQYGHTANYCYVCFLKGMELEIDQPSKIDIGNDQAHVQNGAGLFIYYLVSFFIYTPLNPLYHINY